MQPVGSEVGLQQYLRGVLTQTGQHAVPYSDAAKYQVEDQLKSLRQVFPTLSIQLSDYHTNAGRQLHLLKADGTIPIHHQGNKYNIPVRIWVTERFPNDPPLAYVVPTSTMVIKAGHPNVDSNGQVSCNVLAKWGPKSNLVELCLEMSELFGAAPPLYSQLQASATAAAARPPLPTTAPPPGYPGFGGPPPGPASAYNPPAYGQSNSAGSLGGVRPNSASESPASSPYSWPAGRLPPAGYASGPSEFGTSAASASNSAASSVAASNPLWGAAYLATTQPATQPAGPRPSFNNPPPPGMAGGLGGAGDSGSYANVSGYGYGMGNVRPSGGLSSAGDSGSGSFADIGYGPGSVRPPPPPPPPPPSQPRITRAELGAHFRPLALRALRQQVEVSHHAWTNHINDETNTYLEDQRLLTEHKVRLQAVVRSLKAEREGTEGLVAEMGNKQAQLVAWLARNEPKVAAWKKATRDGQEVDWEKVLLPADDLAKQGMEAQAEDLAYEDTVLALDEALQEGKGVTLEAYLKQVRALCRKQFFPRALGLKVAELQRQAPSPPRAAGVSHAMPVVHGDTWMQPRDAALAALSNVK